MSKKIIAMLTALVMVLGCTGALAENKKHERVYVVAGADGTVNSITDSIRLESRRPPRIIPGRPNSQP